MPDGSGIWRGIVSKYRKQHYLPNFYLKGFSNGPLMINGLLTKEFNVWLYDRLKNEFAFRSTKNIAYEPYYYSFKNTDGNYIHDIEKEFSQLETLAKKVFLKIDNIIASINENPACQKEYLNNNDIRDICLFISNMMKRNTKTIESMTKELTDFYKKQAIKYNHQYDKNEIKRGVLKTMRQLGTSEEYNFVEKLYSKNFYFLYITKPNMSFITSDFPIVTLRTSGPSGIAYPDTEIYFPINRKILLTLYGEGSEVYFRKFNESKKIYSLNKHIAKSSNNIIIGRDEELLKRISRVLL